MDGRVEERMGGSKIKLDRDLLDRVKRVAALAGYASAEEFVTHALEKELAKLEDGASEEEIKKRLRGLGYIS
jgi:metal-responsive CopG/Arc/MetJ family transcriptional regulator